MRRALVRKFPTNCASEENNEVWMYPWRNADEQGRPYTLEGYKYALCTNVPDEPDLDANENDRRLDVANYTVEEHEVTEGEGEEQITRKYWTAIYINQNDNQQNVVIQ